MNTTLRTALDQVHERHAQDPQAAAAMLAAWAGRLGADDEAAEALRLAEHVWLGHCADAAGLQTFCDAMPAAAAAAPAVAAELQRARWALARWRGEPADEPPPPLRWRAMQNLWLARVHLGRADQVAHELAEAQIETAHEADPAALQGLAVATHNLALHLRTQRPPPVAHPELMLAASAASRALWERAGTWTHVERAEYQLALCHAAAAQGDSAWRHACACLALCEQHGADALERFFAHEALARAALSLGDGPQCQAQQQHMQALLAEVAEADDHAFCAATLSGLEREAGEKKAG
jgi:hypothetical protein